MQYVFALCLVNISLFLSQAMHKIVSGNDPDSLILYSPAGGLLYCEFALAAVYHKLFFFVQKLIIESCVVNMSFIELISSSDNWSLRHTPTKI